MKKPVITVVGSYAVGMTMRTGRFPTSGETLMGHNFKQLHGGKGSNQAVECARLGADVHFVSCLGKDMLGESAISLYNSEGVDVTNIKRSDTMPTGVGFVIVDENGNNIITLDLGANTDLTPEYIVKVEDIISRSDVLLMQLEIPTQTVAVAAEIARKYGVVTILNPAPYQHLADSVWANIDFATPNEKEAKLILGYNPEEDVELEVLSQGLLNKGIGNVIITLGDRGAYFAKCMTCGSPELIPVRKVDAVDTTGAGDTFSAALGVAVAEGKALTDAIIFASSAATLSVLKYGVIESMPYRKEVDEELVKRNF
jgi:ribokinase